MATISVFSARMAVFNGVRHLGPVTAGIRTCGLLACPSDLALCGRRVNSLQAAYFKRVKITVTFSADGNKFDMPSTLRSDLKPIKDYSFCVEKIGDGKAKLIMETLSSKELLFSFGFYSRVYNVDGTPMRMQSTNRNLPGDSWICIFMAIVGALIVISVIFIYYAQRTELKLKFT